MIMTSTQYLQVPKVLPHRKGRSRSKSRSQDVVSVEEVRVFPSKSCDSQRLRFTSPPAPLHQQPQQQQQQQQQHQHQHQSHAQQRPHSPTAIQTKSATTACATTTRSCSPVNGVHSLTPQMSKNNNSRLTSPAPTPKPAPETLEVKLETPDTQSSQTTAIRKISAPSARASPVISPPAVSHDLNGEMYTLDDSVSTPPPQTPLRNKIIGAWKLESYIAYPTEHSRIKRPTFPMTKNVTGFIMYTPDGYMSAQMLIPGQQSFKRGEGEEPQWAEAGKRCFAYCGPYYISDEGTGREEVLRHTFQVCNLPGWIGDVQVRTHRFEEDGQVLVLGSEEPTEIKGDKRRPVLKWRRARDNSNATPPPPTPAIKISGPGEP